MSFSLYPSDQSVPEAIIKWPYSKLHGHIVYVSPNKPQAGMVREDIERKAIPPHLRASVDDIKEMEDACIGFSDRKPSQVLGKDWLKRGDHNAHVRQGDLAIMGAVLDDGEELEDYEEDLQDRPEVKLFMQKKLEDAKKELQTRMRDFNIGSGTLELMINPYERQAWFIVGPAGAGKSTKAAELMKSYLKAKPQCPVYLLSKITNDKAFKGIPLTQEPLTEEFANQINSGMGETLTDCMVVFDDIDTVSNDKVRKALWKLRKDLLETGRHGSVYIVNTSHQFRAHEQTKAANKESTHVVMFPDGESYSVTDYCKTYAGMTKEQIKRVMKLVTNPHSWICLSRRSPKHVLHTHGGYFLEMSEPEPPKKKQRMFAQAEE